MEYPEVSYGARRRSQRASRPAVRAICAVIVAAVILAGCVAAYGYFCDRGIVPDIFSSTSATTDGTTAATTSTTDAGTRAVRDIASAEKPADTGTAPLLDRVIIICTHGFESYSDGETVTSLGAYIAERLSAGGISAQFFDLGIDTSFGSYAAAAEALADRDCSATLIDLHVMTLYDGETSGAILSDGCAQMYFSVGATENSVERTAEARRLMYLCDRAHAEIVGDIVFSPTTLNQDIFASSLNVTIGAVGNTYSEAQKTADILINVLTELKKGGCK